MRVLWVFGALPPTQVWVAERLAALGVKLDVMSAWVGSPPLDPARFGQTQLTCHSKLDFAARRAIRRQIETGDYDVVHTYTSRNLANTLAACRGIAAALKIIGYRGTVGRLGFFDPANWITYWHPRVAKIICVCQATERALAASRVPPHKLVTVWEGCDPEALQTPPRSHRLAFDIPEDAFVVGSVANLRPVKGIDLLLRAAIETPALRDAYWLLIGAVNDPRIRKLAAHPHIADRVRLPGLVPAAGRMAGLFDVYAAPSRREGLSMSIMEAMAQGVCPVVSDVGGSPELVEHERQGLVVPTEDAAALGAAIARLRDSALRERLAGAARLRMRDTFSIAAWAERLLDVYREVTGVSSGTERLAASCSG